MPSEPAKALRCAIYTRKSSEEGLEQSFNSLDAQREACAAYILSQRHEGWLEVATRYDDGGFSGGSMNRPALAALMRDIDAGLIDSVVVYKVDRLTRALSDFAKIVDCFDAKKVSFVSVTQQFNTTTSMGRLTLNVLLSFAQFEREVTGERIRDKIAASKKKGMWMGGRVPMGYDLKDRKLVINPHEAEVVRHMYRRYLQLGCVTALKAEFDAEGIASKVRVSQTGARSGGRPYSRGALYELLQNRLFIGQTNHGKLAYAGEHEAVIERELWDAVQEKLRSNTQGRRTGMRSRHPSLLTGRVFTEEGDRLIPSHAVKDGKRYRYYVSAPGSKRTVRIAAGDLEDAVLNRIGELLASPIDIVDVVSLGTSAARQSEIVAVASEWSRAIAEKTAQAKSLAAVVETVVIGEQSCAINCSVFGLRQALLGGGASDDTHEGLYSLTIPFVRKPSDSQARLILQPRDSVLPRSDPSDAAFIKAAARGRLWYEQLTAGKGTSLVDLARDNGVNDRYTSRIMRGALLAPDLVEQSLDGDLLGDKRIGRLLSRLPRSWAAQRKLLRSPIRTAIE